MSHLKGVILCVCVFQVWITVRTFPETCWLESTSGSRSGSSGPTTITFLKCRQSRESLWAKSLLVLNFNKPASRCESSLGSHLSLYSYSSPLNTPPPGAVPPPPAAGVLLSALRSSGPQPASEDRGAPTGGLPLQRPSGGKSLFFKN